MGISSPPASLQTKRMWIINTVPLHLQQVFQPINTHIIIKFIFPDLRGTGRFEDIGLPMADFLGYFVGSFEIICGILVLLGAYTRIAVLPLILIMVVAIITTKIPIILNTGMWEMLHAARTDLSMLLCCLFLLVKGSGLLSIDMKFKQEWGNRTD